MPHFVLHCLDKPGALELRLANRPVHLEHLRGLGDNILLAGPLLDASGQPMGSLIILDAPDGAAAAALAAGDPYAKAGLFASVTITPFRKTLPDA
jgi:uncharacterized protein